MWDPCPILLVSLFDLFFYFQWLNRVSLKKESLLEVNLYKNILDKKKNEIKEKRKGVLNKDIFAFD